MTRYAFAPVHRAARAAALGGRARGRVPAPRPGGGAGHPLRHPARSSGARSTSCSGATRAPAAVVLHRVHRARDGGPVRGDPRAPGGLGIPAVRSVGAADPGRRLDRAGGAPGGDRATWWPASRRGRSRRRSSAGGWRVDRSRLPESVSIARKRFWRMFLAQAVVTDPHAHRRHDRHAGRGLRAARRRAGRADRRRDQPARRPRRGAAVRVRAGRARARRGGPGRGDLALVPPRPPPGRAGDRARAVRLRAADPDRDRHRHGARPPRPRRRWSGRAGVVPAGARDPGHGGAVVRPRDARVRGRVVRRVAGRARLRVAHPLHARAGGRPGGARRRARGSGRRGSRRGSRSWR